MSKLENLTQKILDDAKETADAILAEAEKKNKGIVSSRIMDAEERAERMLSRAVEEAKVEKNRIISNAELRARDEKLTAKQSVMDRAFVLTKERLNNFNEKEYISFLKNTLKNLKLDGSEILVVTKKFKDAVKKSGIRNKVSETETVESGFLIQDEEIVMNYTFDSLVDYLKEELEADIAQVIFKE